MSQLIIRHSSSFCSRARPCAGCKVRAFIEEQIPSDQHYDLARVMQRTMYAESGFDVTEDISSLRLSPALEKKLRNDKYLWSGESRQVLELISHTEAELLQVKYFGPKSLAELKEALAEKGLSLRYWYEYP